MRAARQRALQVHGSSGLEQPLGQQAHRSSAASRRPLGSLTRLGLATNWPLLSMRTAERESRRHISLPPSLHPSGLQCCYGIYASAESSSPHASCSAKVALLRDAHAPMAPAGCSEILSAGENWRRCLSCKV